MAVIRIDGLTLPVTPEKITACREGDNAALHLLEFGQVTDCRPPKPIVVCFEGFFPAQGGNLLAVEKPFDPAYYVWKIEEWMEQKRPVRLITAGCGLELSIRATIEKAAFSEQGGSPGDIAYAMTLKEYRQYGARGTDPIKAKSYTVQPGDTIWSIAKRALGDGGRYTEIMRLNEMDSPAQLLPGMVVRLP